MGATCPPRPIDDHYEVDADTGCWNWLLCKDAFGYGFKRSGGKMVRAHRWMYEQLVAPIPTGMCVLHRCDNPSCANPDHLELGSRGDNNLQREERGRGVRLVGSEHGRAKLTEEEVLEIRARRACGETNRDLAALFGMSATQISDIHLRKSWRHLK